MKRRYLSGEERALWTLATRDVKPGKQRARKAAVKAAAQERTPALLRDAALRAAPQDEGSRRAKKESLILRSAPKARVTKDAGPNAATAAKKTKPAPVLGGGDPKADRRAAKGLIPIEASLDLHGLTEAAAHARTSRFILGAQSDGLRLVLVITGKGARKGGEGRGIIRTRFIDWVETAPLRAAIARAAPAKPKDGGQGAFYVFLKKKAAR